MPDTTGARSAVPPWLVTGGAILLATLYVGVQFAVVRPTAYPGGAGVTVRGDARAGALAEAAALRMARPPALRGATTGLEVAEVFPGGAADRAGLRPGDRVVAIADAEGHAIDFANDDARSTVDRLARWREAWWLDVRRPFDVTVERTAGRETVHLTPVWFLSLPEDAQTVWLQRHAGGLLQVAALLASAVALVALGARGPGAVLMTLTMLASTAVGGLLVGAEAWLPALLRAPLTLFSWLLVPLGYPIVAMAVLMFPTPSAALSRWPALPWALVALSAPNIVANAASGGYLSGIDGLAPLVTWCGERPWLWTATFGAALVANLLIVAEGTMRYRRNPDLQERRRIQMVVYTGIPASCAWSISEGVPVVTALLSDRPAPVPWAVALLLNVMMLLPAFGVPYAVALKRVFSPRTVLRRSLQYALARRTLAGLATLPAVLLAGSLVRQRDMSLAEIVTGRPVFYLAGVALFVAARRYRDQAAQWVDRRFFRAEYDAREILVSLAGRVPFEADPAALVALVIRHVQSALLPTSTAVLAQLETAGFETIGASGPTPPPLPAGSGVPTLLTWSREPLEVVLDDERSGAARLPPADRAWLAATGANLIVPVLAGQTTDPVLMGCLVLGPKQSEEPYTAEDRELLSAIAAQMAVSLDLSRLRRASTPTLVTSLTTVSLDAQLGCCATCRRCTPLAAGACPDHPDTPLVPVPRLPPVIDGKYRVDALIGKGGMGAVYRAHDLRLVRDVAVKVVRGDLTASAEARARFQREALVVARLQHPAVVAIYDVGTLSDGAAYLVMEFVRGEDLRQRLKRTGPLEMAEVVDVMSGVATGVQAAHDAGVLHRDLKPENVLLAEGRQPKVLDFGVAKLAGAGGVDATLTTAGTVAGTPAYMAPEQLRGRATGATDVYSLGVMTFELLTGRLPFGMGSLADIAVAQAEGRPYGVDGLPPALRDVVAAALSFDPTGRPQTPAAFAEALRARRPGPSPS